MHSIELNWIESNRFGNSLWSFIVWIGFETYATSGLSCWDCPMFFQALFMRLALSKSSKAFLFLNQIYNFIWTMSRETCTCYKYNSVNWSIAMAIVSNQNWTRQRHSGDDISLSMRIFLDNPHSNGFLWSSVDTGNGIEYTYSHTESK